MFSVENNLKVQDGGPGNSINYHQYYPTYCLVFPPQNLHSAMQANHPVPSTANVAHYPPHNNPIYYKDERAQRQYFKLEKKLHDKQMMRNENTTLIREELSNNMRQADVKAVEDINSLGTSDDGEESSIAEDENVQIITEILSAVHPPKVSELSSRSALLQWAPPSAQLSELEDIDDINISENDLRYEVLLSDKVKEMKFKSIYNGPHLSCRIQDLKPCHEYYVCLQVHLDEMQGSATDPVIFITPPCEPDQPRPPKLFHPSRNSLQLRWNTPHDNGSHILYYVLEYDEGGNDNFIEFYRGKGKSFTLNKLQSATLYRFRMAAYNEVGRSPYSEVVAYRTLDNPPAQPHPPYLLESRVNSLHLTWNQGPKGEEFILQMNDLENKYGFMNVYHGRDNYYDCRGLNRFSEYSFRLRAKNDDGLSPWSDEVTFRTLPDKPSRPSKPVVKGRIHAHSFKLRWEPPNDTGGTDINGYILEMNSGSGYERVYSGVETEALCDRLTPGTTYQLRVSCYSTGGFSNYSDPCTVTTDAIVPTQCPTPQQLGTPKSDSISICWAAPDYNGGAPVLEYEIEMFSQESSPSIVQKTTETKCSINNLLPGSDYVFRVRAVNRIGPSEWSEPLTVTSGAAEPLVPEKPILNCKSPFQICAEWNEPASNGAPITEYRLEMSQEEKEVFVCVYQGPNRTHEVRSLNPCQKYYFKVQAANHVGFSQFSSVANIVTPAAPPSVINTLRNVSTPTSITLFWNTPASNGSPITHYNIEIGETTISTESAVNEWLIENLHPETTYKIRIQAVNSIANGPWSSFHKITTLRLPPKPPKIECSGVGHNYLKLKWGDKKNLDYIQYCVEMSGSRSQDFQCVYRGSALCCKVNKLQELTSYRFRINATSDAGTGKFSDLYVFTTSISPPTSVKMPKVVEVEATSCTIEWLPSKNNFSDSIDYQIQLTKHKDQLPQVVRTKETKYNFEGLEQATEYSVKIAPVRKSATSELYGPYSPILNFNTLPIQNAGITEPSTVVSNNTSQPLKNKYQLNWDNIQIPSVNWTYIYVFMVMLLGIIISLGIEAFL